MTYRSPKILWTERGHEIVCDDCYSGDMEALTPSIAAKKLEDARRDRDSAEECAYCGQSFPSGSDLA